MRKRPDYEGMHEIIDAVDNRKDYLDWYVLHYDVKTTGYNNDIVFKTFDEALDEYIQEKPFYKNDRVELMFAPAIDDKNFHNNIVIMSKGGDK